MKIKKQDEKMVSLLLDIESQKKEIASLNENIDELKKLNNETSDMYKAKLSQKDR